MLDTFPVRCSSVQHLAERPPLSRSRQIPSLKYYHIHKASLPSSQGSLCPHSTKVSGTEIPLPEYQVCQKGQDAADAYVVGCVLDLPDDRFGVSFERTGNHNESSKSKIALQSFTLHLSDLPKQISDHSITWCFKAAIWSSCGCFPAIKASLERQLVL